MNFGLSPYFSFDYFTFQAFQDQIMSQADVIQATGDAIVSFHEIACLTPRGRYSIKVYPTFLQLHGKTYDYKIPHTTCLRLFLLPHKDQRFMFFVVSLYSVSFSLYLFQSFICGD